MLPRINNTLLLAISAAVCAHNATAQSPPQSLPKLKLHEEEALAIQNHPQVQAAQNEVNYANQQIVENRAANYPNGTGDLTGSQANNLARIGAADLAASRLYDRLGQGVIGRQFITDSGRTSKSSRQRALAGSSDGETSQATRYDVLLQVNRAYWGVLNAQDVVKVAQETVAARQLLSDQVTKLGRNLLRS
jgi:outer membrane protein